MANSFFNFVTRFVSGTTVRAGPINDRLTEIQTGFASVEAITKSALKFAGYSTSTPITATPNSIIQLNASGLPVASGTMGFSPNMGGYRVQNVGNASIGTDAPSYGQMTAYIATIAFGSPNVLTVPAFGPATALDAIRLNAGKTALEFAAILPAAESDASVLHTQTLHSINGTAAWSAQNPNLLHDGDGALESWTENLYIAPIYVNDNKSLARYWNHTYWDAFAATLITQANTFLPRVTDLFGASDATSYVASIDIITYATNNRADYRLEIVWLDGAYTELSRTTGIISKSAGDNAWHRSYVTGTRPASAVFARVDVSIAVKSGSGTPSGTAKFGRVKLERGSVPTAFELTRRDWFAQSRVTSAGSDYYKLTAKAAVSTSLQLRGALGTQEADGTVKVTGGTNGAENDGELDLLAKYVRLGRTAGFTAVYDNGSTGAAKTIDWPTNGAKQKATVSANTVLTLTALASTIVVDGLRLMLQSGGMGGWSVVFTSAATIKWKGNVTPSMPATAGAEMEVIFWWDGSRFLGSWCAI